MWSKFRTSNRQTGLVLLCVGLLLVSSVGPVLAAPRVFLVSASMERSQGVPGEPIDVSFQLRNTGDSGAGGVQIKANGSVLYSDRYEVDSGEVRNITEQITFEEPGVYRVQVNDKNVSTIRIEQTLAETTDVRPGGRSIVLRGGRIQYNSRLTSTFPTTNDTVAVESLTYRTLQSSFERGVEIYTNTSAAPFQIPAGDGTTVFGAVTVQPRSGIDDHQIRIGVNESTVDQSPLASDEVRIYRAEGDSYVPINTTLAESQDGRYVFEAPTNDTETLLVGSLAPSFEVSGHSLSTSQSGVEKRIVVSANVTNTGSVGGDYTATMRLNGAAVSNSTVTLAPNETSDVTVSHRISRDGSYRVVLDEQFIGEVVVATGDGGDEETTTESEPTTDTQTPDQSGETETQTDGPDTETATESSGDGQTDQSSDGQTDQSGAGETATRTTASATDANGGSSSGLSLSADDVGLTEIAIGGSVAVIGVILVLLQRW